MSRATVVVTCGPAGSGKSYVRCARFMADEFLPNKEGVHCSNFPINVEAMVEFVAKKTGKDVETLRSRINIIPPEVLAEWSAGRSGPWDYFRGVDVDGWHIAIDESHNFVGQKHAPQHRAKWQEWIGEIRHVGATIEFISQHPDKIAKEILKEAGLQIFLANSEDRRDPFFKIPLSDWYEMRAMLTGAYESCVWEVHQRRVFLRWVEEYCKKWRFESDYYALYDSYNTPHGGGVKASGATHEFMKRSKPAMLAWFAKRNAWPLSSRLAAVGVVAWLLVFGGAASLLASAQEAMQNRIKGKHVNTATAGAEAKPSPTIADPESFEIRQDIKKIRAEAEAAQQALEQLRAENKELIEQLGKGHEITAIGTDWVAFSGGLVAMVGQRIETGPYAGRFVESVNWQNRSAKFADDHGSVVAYLGAKPVVSGSASAYVPPILKNIGFAGGSGDGGLLNNAASPTAPQRSDRPATADIPRNLSGNADASGIVDDEGRRQQALNDFRERNAARRVPKMDF